MQIAILKINIKSEQEISKYIEVLISYNKNILLISILPYIETHLPENMLAKNIVTRMFFYSRITYFAVLRSLVSVSVLSLSCDNSNEVQESAYLIALQDANRHAFQSTCGVNICLRPMLLANSKNPFIAYFLFIQSRK